MALILPAMFDLIPCPPAGAHTQLVQADESGASHAEMAAAVRAALEMIRARPRLLRYIHALECELSKN